jgi:hypothetical protein
MSIVKDIYNPKIFKVKHIHSSKTDDYDIYVFIGGYYDNKIYKLLDKLKTSDYQSLTLEENKTLGTAIPSFRAKIGKIIPDKIHFVKDLIYEADTINIIRMKISNYISNKITDTKKNKDDNYIGVHTQHLWIRNYNIIYRDHIKFINHLFIKNSEITLNELIGGLQIILDLETSEDIENIVIEHFNEKYKNKIKKENKKDGYTINLFKKEYYQINDLINDEEFIYLLSNRYTILGREYQKNIKIDVNTTSSYSQYVVANPFSSIANLSNKVIMTQESNQYSKTLSDYGLINNNFIYLVSHSEFVENYQGNNLATIVGLYWDGYVSDYNEQKLKSEYTSINKLIEEIEQSENELMKISNSRHIDTDTQKQKHIVSDNYLLNDLVIAINDVDYPINLDIKKIFDLFETRFEMPFVKYVVNENIQNYKIYKPFLKKNLVKLKIIATWKNNVVLPNVKYPVNKKSITFKLIEVSKNIEDYISVSIYENGYILINFNINEYISINKIKEKLEDISDFIVKIKRLNEDKILSPPESNLIFKGDFHSGLLKTQIINVNLKTHIEFAKDTLTLDDVNARIQNMFPFFYGYLKNNVIKVIYKKVNNFDSDVAIQNFIFKLFEKNKRNFESNKTKYLELLENIFLIDRNKSKELLSSFNPQNIPTNVNYHFLYGIDITITKEKNKFILIIENLPQITQMKEIHELFQILFDVNFDKYTYKHKSSHTYQTDDMDIEIEDKQPQIINDNNQEVDLGFDFGELGFGDNELGLNLDYDEEELKKKQAEEMEAAAKKEEEQKLVIDYDIKKKGTDLHKIKFTNYMTQMREKADPGLYKVEDVAQEGQQGTEGWKYSKTCDAMQMRQPYIIPKENLDKVKDKKAITGYVKYRDNYYICPRIWDYKAEMPISVDEFVKNGLKSPYTQGEAIPSDKRNQEYLGDKYTVIIRKPTSSTYWTKENVEKDWPEILKNTGSEAFPGFTKPKNHPKNLCVPCCFLKESEDYAVNVPEIQRLKKPVGHEVCDVDTDSDLPKQPQSQETNEFDDSLLCKNENYIKTDNAILDNCRYGQLPENLNILLRNHQEILISPANNSLHKYANCFLRRGVFSDKNSFLRAIASIKETISNSQVTFKTLINMITDNITPELFLTLNQGTLVNIFKFNYSLPRNRNQLYYFSEFIKKYPKFVEWLGLKDLKINTIDDLKKLYVKSRNSEDTESIIKLRKIRKLFNVFGAFYNFIKYCQDDKIVKKQEFFLDLISRPLDWMFPEGVNIMMFSKETNNIYCNPYINNINKPIIMLLYDKNGKFEPIFHTESKTNIIPKGVIKLNNEVNISSTNLIFIKNHLKSQTINVNLLKDTQKRLPVLKELVKIHLNNCSELPNSEYGTYKLLPTANVLYDELKRLSTVGYPYLEPVSQITTPLHNTEFIITNNGLVFPVRPSGIILELPVYDNLEYFELITERSHKLLKPLTTFNNHTNNKYSYKPSGLFVSEQNPKWCIGILLENEGLIPIYPTLVDELIKESDELKLKLNIIVKPIYYEADYNILENQLSEDDRIGYLTEYQKFEYLYQHFKYEITSVLSENKNSSYLKQIKELLNTASFDYNLVISELKKIIETISNKIIKITFNDITEKNKETERVKGKGSQKKKKYFLTTCDKLTYKKCNIHPYCKKVGKNGCGLNLETTFWMNLFINRLCESIIRNSNERKQILNGEYKPSFYYNEGIKIGHNEIFLTNENFYLIRQIYKSSKYHQEIDVFENVENENKQNRVIKAEYKSIDENSKDIGVLTDTHTNQTDADTDVGVELSGLSGVKKKLKNVYATVFDKDGKYRSQYQAGPCIFPYVYGNNKQLYFDCNKDKEEGQRCPVEVDKDRRALKWGFCPADPRETRRKNKVEEVNAKATNLKGKIDKGFKSGKCIFPFRYHPSYDLSWDCVSTKQGKNQKWCATSMKTGRNIASELPIAADINEKIYQKKWDYSTMYDEKGNFNDEFLRYQTRGYCPISKDKDKVEIKKNVFDDEITVENFMINKCNQTDSKGGYSKKILKEFAINKMGFKEQDIEGKKKEDICSMIEEKINKSKKGSDITAGKSLVQIYEKDPKMCNKGESGGGWYLGTLRQMASDYFGMNATVAREASKSELCNHIVPILEKEIEEEKKLGKENIMLSEVYLKNPVYCEEGPSKGGYSLKDLKEMGVKYFGVDPELNDKSQICKIINQKLKDEKYEMAFKQADFNPGTEMDTDTIDDDSYSYFNLFDDDEDDYKSVKSKKISKKKARQSNQGNQNKISKKK